MTDDGVALHQSLVAFTAQPVRTQDDAVAAVRCADMLIQQHGGRYRSAWDPPKLLAAVATTASRSGVHSQAAWLAMETLQRCPNHPRTSRATALVTRAGLSVREAQPLELTAPLPLSPDAEAVLGAVLVTLLAADVGGAPAANESRAWAKAHCLGQEVLQFVLDGDDEAVRRTLLERWLRCVVGPLGAPGSHATDAARRLLLCERGTNGCTQRAQHRCSTARVVALCGAVPTVSQLWRYARDRFLAEDVAAVREAQGAATAHARRRAAPVVEPFTAYESGTVERYCLRPLRFASRETLAALAADAAVESGPLQKSSPLECGRELFTGLRDESLWMARVEAALEGDAVALSQCHGPTPLVLSAQQTQALLACASVALRHGHDAEAESLLLHALRLGTVTPSGIDDGSLEAARAWWHFLGNTDHVITAGAVAEYGSPVADAPDRLRAWWRSLEVDGDPYELLRRQPLPRIAEVAAAPRRIPPSFLAAVLSRCPSWGLLLLLHLRYFGAAPRAGGGLPASALELLLVGRVTQQLCLVAVCEGDAPLARAVLPSVVGVAVGFGAAAELRRALQCVAAFAALSTSASLTSMPPSGQPGQGDLTRFVDDESIPAVATLPSGGGGVCLDDVREVLSTVAAGAHVGLLGGAAMCFGAPPANVHGGGLLASTFDRRVVAMQSLRRLIDGDPRGTSLPSALGRGPGCMADSGCCSGGGDGCLTTMASSDGAVAVEVTLASGGTMVRLTRVESGRQTWMRELPVGHAMVQLVRRMEANAARNRQQLLDAQRASEAARHDPWPREPLCACRAAEADGVAAADQQSHTEAAKEAWWAARRVLDREIGSVVAAMESESGFGVWRVALAGPIVWPPPPSRADDAADDPVPRLAATLCAQLRDCPTARRLSEVDCGLLLAGLPYLSETATKRGSFRVCTAVPAGGSALCDCARCAALVREVSETLQDAVGDVGRGAVGIGPGRAPVASVMERSVALALAAMRDVMVLAATSRSPRQRPPRQVDLLAVPRRHVYLVVDRRLHLLPLEGMSALFLSQSCSRVLSRRAWPGEPRAPPGAPVGLYLVNPAGDMAASQERLRHALATRPGAWSRCSMLGSEAVAPAAAGASAGPTAGVAPLLDAILRERPSLYLYVGHGCGEAWLPRAELLTRLPASGPHAALPAVLLMGCSSAAMEAGEHFGMDGMPSAYLHAGFPCVVGCQWHVTDGEVDKVTIELLRHLLPEESRPPTPPPKRRRTSSPLPSPASSASSAEVAGGRTVSEALCRARRACRLRYLTGCAVVVYGRRTAVRGSGEVV